jgi:hypothetical protein
VLEFGRKNPLIILEAADPNLAVDAAVFGALMNSGQLCMSTDRIIIHKSLVERLIPRYVERVKARFHLPLLGRTPRSAFAVSAQGGCGRRSDRETLNPVVGTATPDHSPTGRFALDGLGKCLDRRRPNLTIRGDVTIDRVLFDGTTAVAVTAADGTVYRTGGGDLVWRQLRQRGHPPALRRRPGR